MAKVRINTRFLAVVGATIVGVSVAVMVGLHFLAPDNAQHYIEQGDAALHEHNLVAADNFYRHAIILDHKNVDAMLRDGDVLHELARDNASYVGADSKAWAAILTVNPTYMPALQRLMRSTAEAVTYSARAETFSELRDVAERICAVDATDTRAQAYRHIAVIGQRLANIQTDPEAVQKAITGLKAVMVKDPTNPDAPWYVARAYLQLAREQRHSYAATQPVADLCHQAIDTYVAAAAADPENALTLFRYAEVLSDAGAIAPPGDPLKDQAKFVARMRDLLAQARGAAKPGDAIVVDLYILSAHFEIGQNDLPAADKLLHQLCVLAPDDQRARLELAAVLRVEPKQREAALALLREPMSPKAVPPGPGADLVVSGLRAETDLALMGVLLDACHDATDPHERAAIIEDLHATYAKLADKAGTSPAILKVRGRMELMEGGAEGAVKAIQTFEQCQRVLQQRDPNQQDYEVMYLLAGAYYQTHQTGQAKSLLWKFVDGRGDYVPARLMLAQLLFNDGEYELAKDQLLALQKLAPDDMQVRHLWLDYFSVVNTPQNQAQVRTVFASLPESTPAEIAAKASTAAALHMGEQAVRLLEELRSNGHGADPAVIDPLVQAYADLNQRDKALAVAQATQALDKDNARWSILVVQLQGGSAEAIAKLTYQTFQGIKDDLLRELKLFEFCVGAGRADEALQHLVAAEKLAPNDRRVVIYRFEWSITQGKWADAEASVQRIGDLNIDFAHGMQYRFRLLMAQGKVVQAAQVAKELVGTLPEFAQSWVCFGKAQQALGMFEPAITAYVMALEKQSENGEALRGVVESYLALNKAQEAHRYMQAGLKSNPGDAWFREAAISWELTYGDPTKAIEPRLAARDAADNVMANWLELGKAYYRVAQVQRQRGQANQEALLLARQTFAGALTRWPDERLLYAYAADVEWFANNYPGGLALLHGLSERPTLRGRPEPFMMLADYYERFNKPKEMEDALLTALDKSQHAPELQIRLSSLYVQQRRFDDALKVLDPTSPSAAVQANIAKVLIAAGRYPDAEANIQRHLQALPNDAEFLAMLGFIELNTQRIPAAITALRHACEVDARNRTAWYYLGMAYLRARPIDADQAIAALLAARELDQSNLETRTTLAQAYAFKGQLDSAVRELEACLRLVPENKDVRLKLVDLYANLRPPHWDDLDRTIQEALAMPQFQSDPDWPRLQAESWMMRHQPENAKAGMLRAIQLSPGNPDLIREYFNVLFEAHSYSELKDRCDQLAGLPQGQKLPWVFQWRARALRNLDMKDEAMDDFATAYRLAGQSGDDQAEERVIQSISDTMGPNQALARIQAKVLAGDKQWSIIASTLYVNMQDLPKAEGLIQKVLADSSQLTPAQLNKALKVAGSTYMLTGEYDKAQAAYRQLLAVAPQDIAALDNMALLLGEDVTPVRPQEGLDYARRGVMAVEQGRDDPVALDTLGWLLTLCQQTDEGILNLTRSLSIRPSVSAYYHVGQAYLQRGETDKALGNLQSARNLLDEEAKQGQTLDSRLRDRVVAALAHAQEGGVKGSTVGTVP